MHDEAGQAVMFGDRLELALPEVDRVVVQDVEQGVVLGGRERELEDPAQEKGHQAAAAAPLRLQVPDARHRHVVGEVESVVPGLVAIEPARAEPERAEFSSVFINTLCPTEKGLTIRKESPIVIEVVDVDLEPATPHLFEEGLGNRIPILRYDLEG